MSYPKSIKVFVLDTNVLLSDPECATSFGHNMICISNVVISELDKLKDQDKAIAPTARAVLKRLNAIMAGHDPEWEECEVPAKLLDEDFDVKLFEDMSSAFWHHKSSGVILTCPIISYDEAIEICNDCGMFSLHNMGEPSPDHLIIAHTKQLCDCWNEVEDGTYPAIVDQLGLTSAQIESITLVSKDTGLKVAAKIYMDAFEVEDYNNQVVVLPDDGLIRLFDLDIAGEVFDTILHSQSAPLGSSVPLPGRLADRIFDLLEEHHSHVSLKQNSFFLVRARGDARIALLRVTGYPGSNPQKGLSVVTMDKSPTFGIEPKNIEQRAALELLLDDNVKILFLDGPAGTGKSLVSLAACLEICIERGKQKLLISKPTIQISKGQDLGLLPGTLDEKMSPFYASVADSVEKLISIPGTKKGGKGREEPSQTGHRQLDELINTGSVELLAFGHLRGRNIEKKILWIDEAQNLTVHELRTLLTRCGDDTKIVITGDYSQIDVSYLNPTNNGMAYFCDLFRSREEDLNLSGRVTFTKFMRSKVAEIAAKGE